MADFSDSFSSTVTLTPTASGITDPSPFSQTVTLTSTFAITRLGLTLTDHVVFLRSRFRASSGYLATNRYRE